MISAARTITDRFWVFCPCHCGVLSFFWYSWQPLWMKRIKSITTVLTIFYACAKYDGIDHYHGRWISPPCWRDWLLTVISQQILMSISSSLKYRPVLIHCLEQNTGRAKKNELYGLWAQICSWSPIWLFRMCLGIRIPSLFHLATSIMLIQNHKCPKTSKTHAQTWILSPLYFKWNCVVFADCRSMKNLRNQCFDAMQFPKLYPSE